MTTGKYAAVVLAAGFSSRMKQFKPLLPLGEGTVTDRVISIFLQNEVDVFLVVGHRKDELTASLKVRDLTIVDNPDYEHGMFTSIQAGVRRLAETYQGFFVMPVDIPGVSLATIGCLLEAADKNLDTVIVPKYGARRGHPPLLPANMAATVAGWPKTGNLKELLVSEKKPELEVDVADSNILFDIDTEEDYAILLKRFRQER
jgi:CTP:molybdopterin cytidylyltransferase MocA